MTEALSDIYKWKRSCCVENNSSSPVNCFSKCQISAKFQRAFMCLLFQCYPKSFCPDILTHKSVSIMSDVAVWYAAGHTALPVHILCQFPPLRPSHRQWRHSALHFASGGNLASFRPLRLRSFDEERFLLIRKFQRAESNRRLSWSWDSLDINNLCSRLL